MVTSWQGFLCAYALINDPARLIKSSVRSQGERYGVPRGVFDTVWRGIKGLVEQRPLLHKNCSKKLVNMHDKA